MLSATRAAIVRKKRSLRQPEAVEQMQLRGRRRIDGVGRPEFDFYTGLRAGASRPYELARAARRAWSFGRGLSLHPDQSKPSDRAEASERDGAGAAGVAGRVHGFGATGGDTDLFCRLVVYELVYEPTEASVA